MRHVIRQQIIDLNLQGNLDAFKIQHKISQDYWNLVIFALTKVFDRFSSADEVINLDRLVIDLGTLENKSVLESSWTEGISDKILAALSSKLTQDHTQNKRSKVKMNLNIFQQWLFYLEHGHFPWNTTEITGDWERGIIEILTTNDEQLKKFIEAVKNSPQVALRIAMQHNQQFLLKLVEVVNANKQVNLLTLIEQIGKAISENIRRSSNSYDEDLRIIRIKIWHLILWGITNYPIFISPVQFYSALREGKKGLFLPEEVQEPLTLNYIRTLSVIEKLLKKLQIYISNSDSVQKKIEILKKGKSKGKEIHKSASDDYNKNGSANKGLFKNQKTPDLHESNLLNIFSTMDEDETLFSEVIDKDGIFVSNAGIVLLHSFLIMFYEYLEFLDKHEFKNIKLKQKAVILLQYLATGEADPPEFELTIAKVLCAFPSNIPIDTGIEITNDDIEECETLLLTVIERWEVLKGSSISALREDFLQRGGHLFKKNGQLHLRIEQRSIDLLLDHVPWTISMIKLPWLNDILHVEWR